MGSRCRIVAVASWLAVVPALLVADAPRAHAQASSSDDESEIYVQEAKSALAHKDYGDAARLLDRALKVNPRRIDAYILRATVHAVKGEFERGIALLRRALALAPDNPHVMTALGTQLVLAKKADE